MVDKWRQSDCDEIFPPESLPIECDDRSEFGYSRLTERFLYETIFRNLTRHAANMTRFPSIDRMAIVHISAFLRACSHHIFVPGSYLSFPSASSLRRSIHSVWRRSAAECQRNTLPFLLKSAEAERKLYLSPSQMRMKERPFLNEILGLTVAERLKRYPYV